MASYEEQTRRTKRVVLTPRITRAFWSKRRAWQGDKVKLFIETRYLKDGTPLVLEIWEDGTAAERGHRPVVKVPGEHKIRNGRCVAEHTLRFDPATLGQPLTLQTDSYEFHFVVKVQKPALEQKSNLLYVDLHSPVVSA